jgi:hypothetical protein
MTAFREQLGLTLGMAAIERLRLALSDELVASSAVAALRDELRLMAPQRIPKANRGLPWAAIQREALRHIRRCFPWLSREMQEDVVAAAILDALVDGRTARAERPSHRVCELARGHARAASTGREPVSHVVEEAGDTLVDTR